MVEYQGKTYTCPMELVVHLISGKWKAVILWNLSEGALRYSEINRRFPDVTEKVLTSQLRSLEADGLITRTVYPEVPARVEYDLSELGMTLIPILKEVNIWGENYHNKVSE